MLHYLIDTVFSLHKSRSNLEITGKHSFQPGNGTEYLSEILCNSIKRMRRNSRHISFVTLS